MLYIHICSYIQTNMFDHKTFYGDFLGVWPGGGGIMAICGCSLYDLVGDV